MKPIPLSKARKYYRYEGHDADPEGFGIPKNRYNAAAPTDDLQNYWKLHIKNKVSDLRIDRIVLVDHSSTGRSVEATKQILKDAFRRGRAGARFMNVQWALFNVVDARKIVMRDGRLIYDVRDPANFNEVQVMHDGQPHEVDRLLGDENHHDRCQANYYPRRFDRDLKQIWDKDGGMPLARLIRTQIRDHIRAARGNLIRPQVFRD